MTNGDDPTIRAKLLKTMHSNGYYQPRGVSVDGLVNQAPVASHNVGRAKTLVHEMANSDAEPVMYKVVGDAVMLKSDSTDHVMARIRIHDEEMLPWDRK